MSSDPCVPDEPDHIQVGFVTKSGISCEVDNGLFDILTELKRLGVETLYSCEDNLGSAYVMGTGKSFRRLLFRIRAYLLIGDLQTRQKRIMRLLMGSYREFGYVRDGKNNHDYFQMQFSRGRNHRSYPRWALDRDYNKKHGYRTTLRWPTSTSTDVLKMLRSIR